MEKRYVYMGANFYTKKLPYFSKITYYKNKEVYEMTKILLTGYLLKDIYAVSDLEMVLSE